MVCQQRARSSPCRPIRTAGHTPAGRLHYGWQADVRAPCYARAGAGGGDHNCLSRRHAAPHDRTQHTQGIAARQEPGRKVQRDGARPVGITPSAFAVRSAPRVHLAYVPGQFAAPSAFHRVLTLEMGASRAEVMMMELIYILTGTSCIYPQSVGIQACPKACPSLSRPRRIYQVYTGR